MRARRPNSGLHQNHAPKKPLGASNTQDCTYSAVKMSRQHGRPAGAAMCSWAVVTSIPGLGRSAKETYNTCCLHTARTPSVHCVDAAAAVRWPWQLRGRSLACPCVIDRRTTAGRSVPALPVAGWPSPRPVGQAPGWLVKPQLPGQAPATWSSPRLAGQAPAAWSSLSHLVKPQALGQAPGRLIKPQGFTSQQGLARPSRRLS